MLSRRYTVSHKLFLATATHSHCLVMHQQGLIQKFSRRVAVSTEPLIWFWTLGGGVDIAYL